MEGRNLEPEKLKIKKPSELTPEDYQKALDKLVELKPLTTPINSVRINDVVDRLQGMLEEELKELIYKQYKQKRD